MNDMIWITRLIFISLYVYTYQYTHIYIYIYTHFANDDAYFEMVPNSRPRALRLVSKPLCNISCPPCCDSNARLRTGCHLHIHGAYIYIFLLFFCLVEVVWGVRSAARALKHHEVVPGSARLREYWSLYKAKFIEKISYLYVLVHWCYGEARVIVQKY